MTPSTHIDWNTQSKSDFRIPMGLTRYAIWKWNYLLLGRVSNIGSSSYQSVYILPTARHRTPLRMNEIATRDCILVKYSRFKKPLWCDLHLGVFPNLHLKLATNFTVKENVAREPAWSVNQFEGTCEVPIAHWARVETTSQVVFTLKLNCFRGSIRFVATVTVWYCMRSTMTHVFILWNSGLSFFLQFMCVS